MLVIVWFTKLLLMDHLTIPDSRQRPIISSSELPDKSVVVRNEIRYECYQPRKMTDARLTRGKEYIKAGRRILDAAQR
jgi:hypothetical protein